MTSIVSILLAVHLSATASAPDEIPRALIIGDSIHRNLARSAAKDLKGRVEVVVPKVPPGDSSTALTRLDELLGDGRWEVIYFNFGFGDLHYKDPATKTVRAMSKHAGGVRVTTPEQYEKNLRELVKRLKQTGAKLIWSSTTPIKSSKFDSLYDPGSEIQFNAIAKRVMDEHEVPINDMHAYVLENVKDKRDPSPFWFNRIPLHPPVVRSILRGLNLELPKDGVD